jgi:hypothetical protein
MAAIPGTCSPEQKSGLVWANGEWFCLITGQNQVSVTGKISLFCPSGRGQLPQSDYPEPTVETEREFVAQVVS